MLRAWPEEVVAARFHNGLAALIEGGCVLLREQHGLDTVALSGGVFQNLLLLGGTVTRLEARGFTVLTHSRVPCNDGGISLGQAVVAAARERGDTAARLAHVPAAEPSPVDKGDSRHDHGRTVQSQSWGQMRAGRQFLNELIMWELPESLRELAPVISYDGQIYHRCSECGKEVRTSVGFADATREIGGDAAAAG